MKHAEAHCKARGTRLTSKRKQVLMGLHIADKALSAYELHDVCLAELDAKLPVMSIYRILEFLEQEQLVHRLKLVNKYVACSHITCDHEHLISQFLICSGCQSVKEIGIEKALIDQVEANVNKAGYQLLEPQIELTCLCKKCWATHQ